MHEPQLNASNCDRRATGRSARAAHREPLALAVLAATVLTGAGTFADAAAARSVIGVHRGWAAFGDDSPLRCYAMAAPVAGGPGAFASVGHWPSRRVAGQLHVRFAKPARPGSAILLTIDDRVFQLRGRGADAWAADGAADRAIVAAMRTGVAMSLEGRDVDGASLLDRYALSGAATAIDAAAIACRPG